MAYYLTYVDKNTIEKIEIYQSNGKYTHATLKSKLGCDYIINGGLYNMSTYAPYCKLLIDGKVIVSDQWGYIGPAWNNPPTAADDLSFINLPAGSALANIGKKNAIACTTLKYGGKAYTWSIENADADSAIGYAAKRTAIGLKDGKLALCLTTTGMKPSALYNYLNGQGWSDILMLDGGGSTQGYIGSGKQVTSSRKVANFICIYLKKSSSSGSSSSSNNSSSGSTSTGGSTTTGNPYTKPTSTLKYGATGNGVRWVQYQLGVHGHKVDIDGSFGPATQSAVKLAQQEHYLEVDGSVGPDTRAMLARSHPTECAPRLANNPYKVPTRTIQSGCTGEDVMWVQYQLNVFGSGLDVDGSCGSKTVAAIKTFQQSHNLTVDGKCGANTRTALKTK